VGKEVPRPGPFCINFFQEHAHPSCVAIRTRSPFNLVAPLSLGISLSSKAEGTIEHNTRSSEERVWRSPSACPRLNSLSSNPKNQTLLPRVRIEEDTPSIPESSSSVLSKIAKSKTGEKLAWKKGASLLLIPERKATANLLTIVPLPSPDLG